MTRRRMALSACVGILAVWPGFGTRADDKKAKKSDASANANASGAAELARQAQTVLRLNCVRCHPGAGSDTNFLDHKDLLAEDRIKPGAPADSYILQRIIKGEMPPKGENPVPRLEDLSTLWEWVEAGATEFPKDAVKRSFVGIDTVMAVAVKHLREADARDRPYLRFFTLHNLANRPGSTEQDLKIARAALSKAVNSLSRENRRIVPPKAIDAAKLVFAIDLREYGWEDTRIWFDVESAYPFAFRYAAHPDENLRKLDDDLDELLPRTIPILRADWFVATAMRPPLYHTLLQIPDNAQTLEHRLGVDIAADFVKPREGQVAYAGLAKSGVSGQNRQLEVHLMALGGYWKSRDFKPGNARSSLVRFPLGPLNLFPAGHHPFADQAFVHDGGEIIYPLPNGLQAYMLVKGDDARIDAGPIDVVSDVLRTSGTFEIVNGISCNTCHKNGMIGFTDVIGKNSAVFADPERRVKELYAAKETMNRFLQDDTQRFLAALEKAIGPFLREGEDATDRRKTEQFPEPISELARAYRLDYLDLGAVAAEHDVETAEEFQKLLSPVTLKRLGLEALLKKGGLVSRADWETIDNGVSLMQRVGEELRKEPRNRR